jgi:hypothetical protein
MDAVKYVAVHPPIQTSGSPTEISSLRGATSALPLLSLYPTRISDKLLMLTDRFVEQFMLSRRQCLKEIDALDVFESLHQLNLEVSDFEESSVSLARLRRRP